MSEEEPLIGKQACLEIRLEHDLSDFDPFIAEIWLYSSTAGTYIAVNVRSCKGHNLEDSLT